MRLKPGAGMLAISIRLLPYSPLLLHDFEKAMPSYRDFLNIPHKIGYTTPRYVF
jgi:hypothetical protein